MANMVGIIHEDDSRHNSSSHSSRSRNIIAGIMTKSSVMDKIVTMLKSLPNNNSIDNLLDDDRNVFFFFSVNMLLIILKNGFGLVLIYWKLLFNFNKSHWRWNLFE